MSLMRLFARPAPRSFARAFSTTPPSQIAKMTIVGRLAADPEPITTSAAVPLTRYTVATSHGPKDNRQTSFFRVTSFDQGPRRDYVMGLTKGSLVYVEGDASIRVFQDEQGKKHSALNVVQRTVEVLKRHNPDVDEETLVERD